MNLESLGFDIPLGDMEDIFNFKYIVEFDDCGESPIHVRGSLFYINKVLQDIDRYAVQDNGIVSISGPSLQNIVTGAFIQNKKTSRVSYERTTTNK